jgi:hypothetical protein
MNAASQPLSLSGRRSAFGRLLAPSFIAGLGLAAITGFALPRYDVWLVPVLSFAGGVAIAISARGSK